MLVVPSASEAEAVIPTSCPLIASSATVFKSESVSATEPTSNSSASVMDIEKFVSAVEPSALVALTTT